MNRRRLPGTLVIALIIAPPARAEAPFLTLEGANSFWGSVGVPDGAMTFLRKAVREEAELKCFAFSPDGEWVFLCGGNGYYSSNLGMPVCKKLSQLQKEYQDFRCVAFAPGGGWTILSGGSGRWSEGEVPKDAGAKLDELKKKGVDFRSIAYGPKGAWVLLHDKTGVAYGNVPKALADVLDKAARDRLTIWCVAFTGDDWVCLTDNGWWSSDVDLPSTKRVDRTYRDRAPAKWLAVFPTYGPHNWKKFAGIVREALDGKQAGGYAFLALDRGTVVASGEHGWARAPWENEGRAARWTTGTPMMLASVSKTITAVAVLKLWEECRGTDRAFALDDPFWPHIKKFCPQADDGVKRVTIRQLLTHKSGFNKDIDNYLTSPKDLEKLLTQPLAAKPGTVYQYNNDNYYILRLIIEAIGRQHYTPYVREHVLGPMAVTGLTTNPAAKPLALAYGAAADRGPGSWFGGDYDSRAGAVGWFGSAVDLGRFLEGIRTHKVLEPGTTKIMFDEDMGWDSSQPGWTKGGDWNDGRGDWVHTVIAIFPDGVVAAILTNSQMPPGVNASLLGDAWMRGRGR